MTNKNNNTKAKDGFVIVEKIRIAFTNVKCPFELCNFSHEELVQACYDLPYMNNKAFHYVFPKIMMDIINFYPNDLERLDPLLDYTNVLSTIPDHELSCINEVLGNDIANLLTQNEDKIMLHKQQSFSLFTEDQINVLIEWLVLISTWAEAETSEHDLVFAIKYWKHRMASGYVYP